MFFWHFTFEIFKPLFTLCRFHVILISQLFQFKSLFAKKLATTRQKLGRFWFMKKMLKNRLWLLAIAAVVIVSAIFLEQCIMWVSIFHVKTLIIYVFTCKKTLRCARSFCCFLFYLFCNFFSKVFFSFL